MKGGEQMADRAHIPFGADGGEFASSLEETDEKAEKKQSGNRRKVFLWSVVAVIVVAVAALSYFLVMIAKNLSDKERGEEIYRAAQDIFERTESGADLSNTEGDREIAGVYERIRLGHTEDDIPAVKNTELEAIRANISSLKQINPDVVGWIRVDGTKINYPLMQSAAGDDEYYLDHAYTGEYLSLGSIYMVSECDVKLDKNYNTLIYGHNVVNGAMFHDVMKFLDPEFFKTETIKIYTLDGLYVYKPFSVYQTKSDYNYIQTKFGSGAEFYRFAERVKSNSEVPNDITVGDGDTIITLSTCTATGVVSKDRYSLHAKLVEFKS